MRDRGCCKPRGLLARARLGFDSQLIIIIIIIIACSARNIHVKRTYVVVRFRVLRVADGGATLGEPLWTGTVAAGEA